MGTIIEFPTRPQDIDVNYYGLELFVESCCKLLDTLPLETRHTAKREFNRLVERLIQFMDECQEARSRE
jgi:hypothetical protein